MLELQGRTLLAAVTTLTSLGFLLIGYDNGVLGGLVNGTAFNDTFNTPNPTIVGLIVAIYEVGCFLGAVAASIFGEQLGRRKTIAIGVVVMILGAVLQAASYSRTQMIISRIVAGCGMGAINSTAPVLQAEFSPKTNRGLFVCMQLSTLNFGIFFTYWIDYAFSSHTESFAWRVPVILQCIFLIPMLFLILIIPETPRWLAAHGKEDESFAVLQRLKGYALDDESIRKLHAEIVQAVRVENLLGTSSWKDMLKRKDDGIQSRRRLLIACGIQTFQQLGGINAIVYYSGTLFQSSIGFDQHMSALMAGFLQTWFFVASFIPWFLIDRIGRRPLLLSMISVMAAVMAVQASLIYQIQHKTSSAHSSGIAAAAMLFLYQGAFTIGFQATVWVYPSEILPLRLRQRGSSISTAANWIWSYVVVQITPPAIANIGWRTYIIFAVLNATWVPIIYMFFPETKGFELEEIDSLFIRESDSENINERSGAVISFDKVEGNAELVENPRSR